MRQGFRGNSILLWDCGKESRFKKIPTEHVGALAADWPARNLAINVWLLP